MGWSPILWTVVDDVIITLTMKYQDGQVLVSMDGKIRADQTIDAYVDDSNLAVNQKGVEE